MTAQGTPPPVKLCGRVIAMRIPANFLIILLASLASLPAAAGEAGARSTSNQPPRKVIVGTVVKGFWGEYPGLAKRLNELNGLIDRMADEAKRQYGRGLDLAVLPEVAVNGEGSQGAIAFDGPVKEAFTREARERHCYIVAPLYLLEDGGRTRSNAAILIGRNGEIVGAYRKLHLAVLTGSDSMEGGVTPGKEVRAFQCDFGKLGIQICFDIRYDYGWKELARQGADLVAWPTQSPGTAHPAFRALANHFYIVSSTWRHNASIFEPTGKIAAQVKPPGEILVHELDLSYALVPWSSQLRNGAAFREKYGDKVGFHYYEDEDLGIFWSNDPRLTVGRMVRSLGLSETQDELRRIRKLYGRAGVPGY
jgi:predicted amidohydrolase